MEKAYSAVTNLLIAFLIISWQVVLCAAPAQAKKERVVAQLRSTSWEERDDGLKEVTDSPMLLEDEAIRRELISLLEKENVTAATPLDQTFGARWREYHLYYRRLVDVVVRLHDPSSVPALMDIPLYGGYIEPGTIIWLLTTVDPVIRLLSTGNPAQKQGAMGVIRELLSQGPEKITIDKKTKLRGILLRLLKDKGENRDVKLISIYTLKYFPSEDVLRAVQGMADDPYYYILETGEKHFPFREAAREVIQELKVKMQEQKREH